MSCAKSKIAGSTAITKLWLTTHGEEDRSRWRLIAPKVDGTWFTEWLAPDHLLLTDHGAWCEERQPYRDQFWNGIRIETCKPPIADDEESPDGLFRFVAWESVDSRGRLTSGRLDSTWRNPNHACVHLVPQGPWSIAASWCANDHLALRITPDRGAALPDVPASVCGIRVTVVGR